MGMVEEKDRGRAGGLARAEKLTAEDRSRIASEAALARWMPKATHTGEMQLGGATLACHVLEDGRRVLSSNGLIQGLGMSKGSRADIAGDRVSAFLASKAIKPFVPDELLVVIGAPIKFRHSRGGGVAYGVEATILPDICAVVLDAAAAGVLQRQQKHIVERCGILLRAFAKVGIVALVDEATGYQATRERDELHRLLEVYIAKELLPWTKKFPDEFYKQMFRLREWTYPPKGAKTTRYVGKLTNEIVYEKLPPGVLTELKEINPVVGAHRKHKHHQFLTEDIGNSHLTTHLQTVTAMMRGSTNWGSFRRILERAFPTPGGQVALPLEEA